MTTGERIRELRKARHMTQDQLAQRAKVTKQAVSMWEADKSALSLTSAQLLCDIFNVEMDYLTGRHSVTMRYLDTEELDVIDAYRALSDEGKTMICKMLEVKRNTGQEGEDAALSRSQNVG